MVVYDTYVHVYTYIHVCIYNVPSEVEVRGSDNPRKKRGVYQNSKLPTTETEGGIFVVYTTVHMLYTYYSNNVTVDIPLQWYIQVYKLNIPPVHSTL